MAASLDAWKGLTEIVATTAEQIRASFACFLKTVSLPAGEPDLDSRFRRRSGRNCENQDGLRSAAADYFQNWTAPAGFQNSHCRECWDQRFRFLAEPHSAATD